MAEPTTTRILLVHDDRLARVLLVEQLGAMGYSNVATASDGSEALESLSSEAADLVITDAHMPVLDGFQLCRLMRSPGFADLNQIPLVLISGVYSERSAVRIARDVGAQDFLPWPVVAERLRDVVTRALVCADEAPRLLVAEDDEAIARAMEGVLRKSGFEVTCVGDGAEAIEAGGRWKPDLVLCDYMMPRANGGAVLSWFREHRPETPVIVLTAFGSEVLAAELMRGGAFDYIPKPIDLRSLAARCRAALRRTHAARPSRQFREMLEQIRRSEARYRALLERAGDAVLVLDAAGEVREANERAELLFGRSRAAMVGRPFEALAGPGPADLGGDGACEIRVVRGDGDVRIAALTASRVDFGEEALRLIILRDVTDARRVELELRQSQKMEAVGRLASGVAHDFNNILSVILGEAEWALTRLPAGGELSEIRESIALIQDTGGQAVHLVRQLLAFSRKQPATPQVLSLGDLVTGVGGMLRRLLGRDVELRVETAPDLRPILADPSQLAQVLLNLGVNARDAMPDGGTLTLHTANAGASVLLEVRDTGCGMSPEVQARIFEPFFTTKEPGKGTGLGLSTVYGIVQQAGGSISVESEVGRGTVFRVLFPAAGAPAA